MVAEDCLRVEGIYRNGYGSVPKFVMHDLELSLESKAIYAYLCSLAGNRGKTFPYRETILKQLKLAKNTYYKHYKPLVEKGYIKVDRTSDKLSANIYTLVSNPKKLEEYKSPFAGQSDSRLRYHGLKKYGYGFIPRFVMQDTRISIKAKGLYAFFCSYCGCGDVAFPLKENILYYLGISEPTYYKALNQLKEFDYIHAIQRKISGKFSVNDYILNEFPKDSPYINNYSTKIYIQKESCKDNKDLVSNVNPIICDTENRDTKKQDAKNEDAYIISDFSNNRIYNNNHPIKNDELKKLVKTCISKIEYHDDAEVLVNEFLPSFCENIKNKQIRNLSAYITASLKTYVIERPVRQLLFSKDNLKSYDISEIERMINHESNFLLYSQ